MTESQIDLLLDIIDGTARLSVLETQLAHLTEEQTEEWIRIRNRIRQARSALKESAE